MDTSLRQVSECLGALEASVTHFACEDFESLLATFGETITRWPASEASIGDVVRISQRLYSALKIEGGERAMLLQCDVVSRVCKQVQEAMFELYVESSLHMGLDGSKDWIVEMRLVQRDLSTLGVGLIRKIETMSTLDIPLDVDGFKLVRSRILQVDMIVSIIDEKYLPMMDVDKYFDNVIDIPVTGRQTTLGEIAMAFSLAGKELPAKISRRMSANETVRR